MFAKRIKAEGRGGEGEKGVGQGAEGALASTGERGSITKPLRGSVLREADLLQCVGAKRRGRSAAAFPERSGITLPHPFPSKLDCSCLPSQAK